MSKASRQKHRIWLIIAFVIVSYFASKYSPESANPASAQQSNIEQLIQQHKSNVQVKITAQVFKLLRDDLDGSRHQRFLIKLSGGETILIAHNIDLAPRLDELEKGDIVTLHGEYEWNEKGGVIHWTHHDPAGRHIGGWIKHQGKTYQ
ncbi:MAG: DNA-binding protein [Methylophaga sp.]|nr:MAG: DNA-binding protein [Methylophaga sp.]